MSKELLQQALDALLECGYATTIKSERLADAAIKALKEAIAQPEQPTASIDSLVTEFEAMPGGVDAMEKGRQWVSSLEQEPVAYLCENAVGHKYFRWKKPSGVYKPIPLYTSPPQREWVSLTQEDINASNTDYVCFGATAWHAGVKWAEAKLKDKNTSPPQRPWVGLTEDEATFLWETTHNNDSWELIKRVEAKLKEKNK